MKEISFQLPEEETIDFLLQQNETEELRSNSDKSSEENLLEKIDEESLNQDKENVNSNFFKKME
jgi:hypothetical protein